MDEWFVCVPGGEAVGPVSTALLLLGIRSGKVPDDALVCRVGATSWTPLVDVKELSDALPGHDAFRGAAADTRYARKDLLGKGGMGEVHLSSDQWIGRDVAMKIALPEQNKLAYLRARFVREALVQGQLEHPSVVPVYDLGTRADGSLFFTMKRVRGLTLGAIVAGLKKGDPEITKNYGRRKLLTAMSQVCLAVSFAHSRGVVHRDLKPDNVMLGDFGEVYVLDWGVAKVLEDAWAGRSSPVAAAPVGRTQAGAMVGTPGYAAPEQVRGEGTVGPASDVYALGAILFEILALEPLHRGDSNEALVASTIAPSRSAPSSRASARGVPPELDAIVARATALDVSDRIGSARELHDAIERYLDGERDAERRRELAREHTREAERAFGDAARGGKEAESHRVRGMRELSAALALDPGNEATLRMLVGALLESPDELPPEAEAELAEIERKDRIRGARDAVFIYLVLACSSLLLVTMTVRRPVLFALLILVNLATAGYMAFIWRASGGERRYTPWSIGLAFGLVGLMSTIFGPLVMVPGTAAVTIAGFLVIIRADRRARVVVLGAGLASVLVPTALQFTGLAPPSYAFENGSIRIVSNLVELTPIPSLVVLVVSAVTSVYAASLTVGRAVQSLVAAERRTFAQAWRLRQMLPVGDAGTAKG